MAEYHNEDFRERLSSERENYPPYIAARTAKLAAETCPREKIVGALLLWEQAADMCLARHESQESHLYLHWPTVKELNQAGRRLRKPRKERAELLATLLV